MAATSAGVFAMEAMWSRYLPQADVIAQLLRGGELGDVRLVTVDLGWKFPFDAHSRAFDPELGGGAMLDAGVYSLWFSQFVLGAPAVVLATGSLASTGVDVQAAVSITSAGGAQAAITTSILVATPGLASIYGTDARVEFDTGFVFPASFRFVADGAELAWHDESGLEGRDGLAWEAVALAQYVAEGRTQSPVHPLDQSISLMRTIDEVRGQLGAR